jgi:hypothetical protein
MESVSAQVENSSSETADFLTRVMAAVVPAIVAETIKMTRDPGVIKYTADGKFGEMAETLSKKLIAECNFDCDGDGDGDADGDGHAHTHTGPASVVIGASTADDVSHIQGLKLDLYHLQREFVNHITSEIRDELKSELKIELLMEMRKELELMKKSMGGGAGTTGVTKFNPDSTGMMPSAAPMFTVTSGANIRPVVGGYESIAAMQPKPTKTREEIEAELMKSNPTFASVAQSLDRQKRGESAHSTDEYLAARANRMDADAVAAYKETQSKARFAYDDEEDPEEEEKWAKLMSAKMGNNYN